MINKFRIPLALFSMTLAVIMAFAFTPKPKIADVSSAQSDLWVKYDCTQAGQVAIIAGGNTSATNFSACTGRANVCARKYHANQLTDISGHPGNKQPIDGATVLDETKCP